MAAFADGLKDDREREAVKQVADALGGETGIDLPALFRDVLLSKPDLAQVVPPLTTPELKQYAYEMAVGVANADGAQNDEEKSFLERLRVRPAVASRTRECNERQGGKPLPSPRRKPP